MCFAGVSIFVVHLSSHPKEIALQDITRFPSYRVTQAPPELAFLLEPSCNVDSGKVLSCLFAAK